MKAKMRMLPGARFQFDAASAISQGRRERQEDAVAADFPVGSGFGFAVLADGMGGHDAGDVASHLVVTEVFSELKLQSNNTEAMEQDIVACLRASVEDANTCLAHLCQSSEERQLMGATVVAPVLFEDRLYWISVGDSALWLFRDGKLQRLTEDHSMAPEIDAMYDDSPTGRQQALAHPDRNCLTSVLIGDDIPKIDCSETPLQLRDNDILLLASDGLEFLEQQDIEKVLGDYSLAQSAVIGQALLEAIEGLDDPDQDNVALCVIRVRDAKVPQKVAKPVRSVTLLARKGDGDAVICISKQSSAKQVSA